MFALRTFTEKRAEFNQVLGNSYTVVNRFENYEEFKKEYSNYFLENHVADLDENSTESSKLTYAFVSGLGGSFIRPLYMNQKNYIVTESGKTYSNISYK